MSRKKSRVASSSFEYMRACIPMIATIVSEKRAYFGATNYSL